MQNSSNPNSAGPSKPPKRFLKKGLLTFATCMTLADAPLSVLAQYPRHEVVAMWHTNHQAATPLIPNFEQR